MLTNLKVDVLTLGDELLNGIRENAHLTWLGEQLSRYGLMIRRNVVIRDNADEIYRFFGDVWADTNIVITTGGLGPTPDDLTRETIAKFFGVSLVNDDATEQAIRDRFNRMGRKMTDNNLRQAKILDGAEVLPNPHGTAPGQFFSRGGKLLFMLPGPSNEMHPMFTEQVLPRLRARKIAEEQESFLQVRTCGIGESMLDATLSPVFEPYLGRLDVSFCAHYGIVDVRLAPHGHSLTREEIQEIGRTCQERLGDDFVCFGDCSLAAIVLKQLRALDRSISVAESCTGGALASAFTDISGASKSFAGGIVCYNNDAKIQLLDVPESLLRQHGAISAECAVAMATGAAERFGSDYGLSITGFAGPEGGTNDNPVGTIFFGYHAPSGVWSRRVVYPGNRLAVKTRAVHTGLDWMRRKLKKYAREESGVGIG